MGELKMKIKGSEETRRTDFESNLQKLSKKEDWK